VGLRYRDTLLEKGDPEWQNPNLRLRNITEYADAITSNASDELIYASFLCERSQFKDGDGKWRSVLEDDFLKSVCMAYVTDEDLEGALGRAGSSRWLQNSWMH
jgi:hypothetical protein